MRVSNPLSLLLLCCGLSSIACDRIDALKDRLFGASESVERGNPDLEAIESLYQSGRYDEALQKIDQLTQEQPDMVEAYYYQGLCHLAKAGKPEDLKGPLSGDEQASLDAFQRALAIHPRHAPSAIGIGDLYSRRVPARRHRGTSDPADPYTLAREAYEKAVTIDPKLPDAQHHYARFLERTGQLEEAERAFRAAVEAAATIPEIAPDYYLAYARFLAGPADRPGEALEQFELARMFRQDDTQIQQEMAIVHSRIGLRHFEKQEYLLAEEALTRAQTLFPDKTIPEAQKASETLDALRSIRRR